MSPCITPEPLLCFFWGGFFIDGGDPLHPHRAVLWGRSGHHSGADPAHLWLGGMGSTCGHHPSRPLWGSSCPGMKDSGQRMGARSPWDPLHQPFPHTGIAGGFREGIPPVPLHPGSSPSPAQHRVALSYFYFYILLFLFLFFPFKPTQQPTIPTPPPPSKKKKKRQKRRFPPCRPPTHPTPSCTHRNWPFPPASRCPRTLPPWRSRACPRVRLSPQRRTARSCRPAPRLLKYRPHHMMGRGSRNTPTGTGSAANHRPPAAPSAPRPLPVSCARPRGGRGRAWVRGGEDVRCRRPRASR